MADELRLEAYGTILKAINLKAQERLEVIADDLAQEVRDLHEEGTPGSGQNFNDFGYRRSAPLDPPAIEYGDLYNSIAVNIGPDDITVGSDKEYAEYLEFGTIHMAARPMWLVALNRIKARYGSL